MAAWRLQALCHWVVGQAPQAEEQPAAEEVAKQEEAVAREAQAEVGAVQPAEGVAFPPAAQVVPVAGWVPRPPEEAWARPAGLARPKLVA